MLSGLIVYEMKKYVFCSLGPAFIFTFRVWSKRHTVAHFDTSGSALDKFAFWEIVFLTLIVFPRYNLMSVRILKAH